MKAKTVSSVKKKVWTWYSLYIRLREADIRGFTKCVTCGVVKFYKEMQAGHFIPGRHSAILFDEQGVHQQCYHCNVGLNGNPRKYDAFMRDRYGTRVIKRLEKLDATTKQFTIPELEKMLEVYKIKVKIELALRKLTI